MYYLKFNFTLQLDYIVLFYFNLDHYSSLDWFRRQESSTQYEVIWIVEVRTQRGSFQ